MSTYDYNLAKMTTATMCDYSTYGYKGFSISVDCGEIGSIQVLDSKRAADEIVECFEDLFLAEFNELTKEVNDLIKEKDLSGGTGFRWAIQRVIDSYLMSLNFKTARRIETALIKARDNAGLGTLIGCDNLISETINKFKNK